MGFSSSHRFRRSVCLEPNIFSELTNRLLADYLIHKETHSELNTDHHNDGRKDFVAQHVDDNELEINEHAEQGG